MPYCDVPYNYVLSRFQKLNRAYVYCYMHTDFVNKIVNSTAKCLCAALGITFSLVYKTLTTISSPVP